MRTPGHLFLILLMMAVAACTGGHRKAAGNIERLEEALYSDTAGMIDHVKADELVKAYIDYADAYPEDTQSPEFLFRAGELMMNLSNPPQSVVLFDRLLKEYPDYEKAAEALFLQAFVYENNIGDLQKARELYTEFLEKYPDNDFADDAEICIQNLGKSPEELIREFEERQKLEQGSDTLDI